MCLVTTARSTRTQLRRRGGGAPARSSCPWKLHCVDTWSTDSGSVESAADRLGPQTRYPDDPSARVSKETIYQEIYRPGSGIIRKPERSPLRTGRDHRRGQSRQVRTRRRFAQPMSSVHDRGFDPIDRSIAGHWEGDLIVGPHNRSAIGTLVERQTRFV